MTSDHQRTRDLLHGITLEAILTELVERHGWNALAVRIPVRCFQLTPTIKSSLTFLRKTPWARQKIEEWYVAEKAAQQPVVKRFNWPKE